MVTVFTRDKSRSSRLALQWLDERGIPYKERNVTEEPFTTEELLRIFYLTQDGLDDVLSTSSNFYQTIAGQIDDMTIFEVIELAKERPELLRYPLIENGQVLHVGFAQVAMGVFYTREERAKQLKKALEEWKK